MKKAIIYRRVACTEQGGKDYSLQHQEDQLRKYCALKQIEVVEHFQDAASGTTFNRPEFQKALEFLRKNKKCVDLLLFTKWDRFSRNISEAYRMIGLLTDLGVECNAIEQPLDLSFYLATPEIENDRRSMNTREGMRKAMRAGRWVGRTPNGYKMGRDEQNKPLMCPTSDAPFIKEGFELYSTGLYSISEVIKMLEQKGFKMSKNQFVASLRNPIYCGKIVIPAKLDEVKEMVKGLHQAIIEEELFQKCQRIEQ